jgi:hypothetical protein
MKKYFTQVRRFVSKNVSVPVMVALLFVGGVAEAKTLYVKHARKAHQNDVTWTRTGTVASPNGNTWVQSNLSGSCATATRICKATFVSGYNPNSNTYTDNADNATSIIADAGYHTNP